MNQTFHPAIAAQLGRKTAYLIGAGQELSSFGEEDPVLAGECGVEICSLEARTILGNGAPFRVVSMAEQGARLGRPVTIPQADMDAVSRLEAVVAMGAGRISVKLASMDAATAQEPAARLGNLVGLATGAVGFIRSIL